MRAVKKFVFQTMYVQTKKSIIHHDLISRTNWIILF
jgi:hypothetical protein